MLQTQCHLRLWILFSHYGKISVSGLEVVAFVLLAELAKGAGWGAQSPLNVGSQSGPVSLASPPSLDKGPHVPLNTPQASTDTPSWEQPKLWCAYATDSPEGRGTVGVGSHTLLPEDKRLTPDQFT